MKRIPLCAAVLLLFSLLACKNKPAASSDKRPASASDTLSDDALMDTVQRRTFQYFWEGGEPYSGMARERYHIDNVYPAGGPEVVTSGRKWFWHHGYSVRYRPGLCEPAGRARKNGQDCDFP